MNRKQSQSQRNAGSQFQSQRGMKAGQSSQNYGQQYSQGMDHESDYETSQFGSRQDRFDRQDRFGAQDRQELGRNFSGRSSYTHDDQYMDSERTPSSYRDTDYDLDGSTYGSQGRSPRSMDRNFGGRLGSSYGHSDYETNDRNASPSRYSSLDDDRHSSTQRNFDRQGSSSERFGYPSSMNAWSGSDRSFNSGRTSGRMGQGQWSGSDMDVNSYGAAGSAPFGSFGESSHGSEYESERSSSSQRGFFGKGPKGYKRSDDRIKEDVCETLARNPRVDASDIEVKVEGSVVTLSGTVDSKDIRRAAEMAIENLSGVDDVRNELKVKKAGERGMDSTLGESRSTSSTASKSTTKGSGHI